MDTKRKIIFYKDYFEVFFNTLDVRTRSKIDYVLYLVQITEFVPVKFLRKIKGQKNLWEIRIESESNIYRIFCCFDEGKLVVLFNGFQKKSQKTPANVLKKAIRIMDAYFEYRNSGEL